MARAELVQAIDGLSEAKLTEPSLDGWSVKDHLAHLAQWHEVRYLDTLRLAAGKQSAVNSTPEQDELFNQVTAGWRRPLSLEQVMWELATSRQRVLDAVEALGSEGLERALQKEWPLRTGHESEHAGYIRLWRQSQGI